MKKILAMLVALLMIVSLTACVSESGGDFQKPSDVSGNDTPTGETEGENVPDVEQQETEDVTITEAVLVDEAGVKITAKSLSTDSFMGPEIKLLIENNSGKDLTVQTRNSSVNGYMVDTMMSADVVNGKKANDSMTIMDSDLEDCGIATITDIEFSFHIFTSEDWETYLDTDMIQIKTSAAETHQQTYDDSGSVAYDANGIKIVVKGLSGDESFLGDSIVVYIENNNGKNVTVQTRDVSINGFMVDPIFSCEVVNGKRAVDTITFMSSDLEENEITAIETVELSFHIFDADGWDTIVDTDVVTITF